MLLSIIAATFIVSLMSLVGLILFHKNIKAYLHYFISFAAGTLLAVTFFDLIPESLEAFTEAHDGMLVVLVGIIIFFLIERFIHWHHCGKDDCHEKPTGILILTGDFVHNFVDGLLIAGAFLLDWRTGLFATISIIAHEIPQEIGDYSVLLHSGYKKAKALLLNFYSALSSVVGGIIGYFAFSSFEGIIPYIVALAGGGFLYIALSDIVPAMHKHKTKSIVIESIIFVVTIIAFYFILGATHAHG